jgi:hypothetical protein
MSSSGGSSAPCGSLSAGEHSAQGLRRDHKQSPAVMANITINEANTRTVPNPAKVSGVCAMLDEGRMV